MSQALVELVGEVPEAVVPRTATAATRWSRSGARPARRDRVLAQRSASGDEAAPSDRAIDMLTYKARWRAAPRWPPSRRRPTSSSTSPRRATLLRLLQPYSIARHHSLRVRVELRSDDVKVPSITRSTHRRLVGALHLRHVRMSSPPSQLAAAPSLPEFQGHPLRKDYRCATAAFGAGAGFPRPHPRPGPGPGGAGVP